MDTATPTLTPIPSDTPSATATAVQTVLANVHLLGPNGDDIGQTLIVMLGWTLGVLLLCSMVYFVMKLPLRHE